MFRRKKVELEDEKPVMEKNDGLGIPGKPGTAPGAGLGSSKPPVMPTRPTEATRGTETIRPGIEMPRPPVATTPGAAGAAAPARKNETEHRKLIVGREIA